MVTHSGVDFYLEELIFWDRLLQERRHVLVSICPFKIFPREKWLSHAKAQELIVVGQAAEERHVLLPVFFNRGGFGAKTLSHAWVQELILWDRPQGRDMYCFLPLPLLVHQPSSTFNQANFIGAQTNL